MIAKRNLRDSVAWLRGHGPPRLLLRTTREREREHSCARPMRITARKPLINRRLSEDGAVTRADGKIPRAILSGQEAPRSVEEISLLWKRLAVRVGL